MKDLEKVKAEELGLFAEAGIRDLGGKRMLQSRDVGALLDWPVPASVDLARASWKPAAGGTA